MSITPHLVIDARVLSPQRDGISTYLRGIVPRLARKAGAWRITTIVSPELAAEAETWGVETMLNGTRPMWPRQNITIPSLVRNLRADVFFYPAHDPPLGSLPCPLVMTVHDLTPFEIRPFFETWDVVKNRYLRLVVGHGVKRAARVIAVSDATQASIAKFFGPGAARKTRVIYNGHDQPSTGSSHRESHILYLGTDRPHKNVLRLIDGYALARLRDRGIPPLVLAGGFRSQPAVEKRLVEAGVASFASILGHVADPVAEALINDAMALVVPSLAEGFGIPILEAMARGVPVITSDRSGCAEVAGDAALLVDPLDAHSIADAISRVVSQPGLRKELARRGVERAQLFDWDKSASGVFDTISSVFEEKQ